MGIQKLRPTPTGIKSIQRGATSSTSTVTISEVDMNKSVVIVSNVGTSLYSRSSIGSARLTTSTELAITAPGSFDQSISTWSYQSLHWQVVEYY